MIIKMDFLLLTYATLKVRKNCCRNLCKNLHHSNFSNGKFEQNLGVLLRIPRQVQCATSYLLDLKRHTFANAKMMFSAVRRLVGCFLLVFFSFVYFHYYSVRIAFQCTTTMTKVKFQPLYDRVMVEKLAAEVKSKGGIMIPEKAQGKVVEGTVVAVGPGARNEVRVFTFSCVLST
jgi:hypothetical protein